LILFTHFALNGKGANSWAAAEWSIVVPSGPGVIARFCAEAGQMLGELRAFHADSFPSGIVMGLCDRIARYPAEEQKGSFFGR